MDCVLASMSPDDTAAALRLLKVLEECRHLGSAEAEARQRRIMGWAEIDAEGMADQRSEIDAYAG